MIVESRNVPEKVYLFCQEIIFRSWRDGLAVRTLVALSENPGLILSSHKAANNVSVTPVVEDLTSLASMGTVHIWYENIRIGKTPPHIK